MTIFTIQRFIIVLLLVMGLSMTGTVVVPMLLVEEKEKRTLHAILLSPASFADVVAAKALTGLLYALLVAGLLLALNDGLHGNVVMLGAAVLLGGLFLVEVGLLMGAAFNTSGQVNTWSSVVMMAMVVPSWTAGVSVSREVEMGMRVLPTYHLTQLLVTANGGTAAGNTWEHFAVLGGCVAVLFAAIVWSLRRYER